MFRNEWIGHRQAFERPDLFCCVSEGEISSFQCRDHRRLGRIFFSVFFSFSHHSKPWPSMMVIREQIPEWRKLPRWKELRRKKLLDLGGGGLQTTKQWHIESGFSSITFPRSWKLGCGDVWGFPWSGVKLFASSFFKFCLFMLDDSYTLGSRSKNSFGLNREDYWSFESLCLSRGKRRAEFATN